MDNRKSPQTPPSITYYGFILVKKCNGSDVCGRFPVIKKEVIIGRHNSCDIRILLSSVSDIHCTIQYINESAFIRDKSTSGTTKVNEKKIGRNNFMLNHSDEIEICGRKFVWEYASSYAGFHKSGKKSGTRKYCITPRASEQLSNHTTPLVFKDCNKLLTSAKSATKTPSKTLISYNKTPIVVAATNVSKLSFDELKNSFKRQSSTTITRSERKPTNISMVSSPNTQIIDDTDLTQRKLWFVTPPSKNSTSNGTSVLDQLSNERLKRDSTPEFSSSYCYEDESVRFDSPFLVHNKEQTDDNINISVTENNLHNTNDQSDLQFSKETHNLPDSKPELSPSRRDTFSVYDSTLSWVNQLQLPAAAPRQSILKGSKSAKPNRSRSSCRMVQFAHFPKTEGKINKLSKHTFKFKTNSTVIDDETVNETNCSVGSKKDGQFDNNDLDDDLDGVQPLDSSIPSLFNSPILDDLNINKSIKCRSRGNKVMSLVNSIEKQCHNECPKLSIRASDLLSINDSNRDKSFINRSQNKIEENTSSTRRINLENTFKAEDSLKDATCNLGNETLLPRRKSSDQTNHSYSFNIDNDVLSKNGLDDTFESEYNFASPLNLPFAGIVNKISLNDQSTCVESNQIDSITEVIDHQFNERSIEKSNKTSRNMENCNTPTNNQLSSNNIDYSSNESVHVKGVTLFHNDKSINEKSCSTPTNNQISSNNIDNSSNESVHVKGVTLIHNDKSINEKNCSTPTNNQISSDNIDYSSNESVHVKCVTLIHNDKSLNEKSCSTPTNNQISSNNIDNSSNESVHVKGVTLIQNDDSINEKNCCISNYDEIYNKKSSIKEKNSISEYANKTNDTTNNQECPSMIVQCMSEMFDSSEPMSKCTSNDNLLESYVVLNKDNLPKSLEKNKSLTVYNESTKLGYKSIAVSDNSITFVDVLDSIKEKLQNMITNSFDAVSNSYQEHVASSISIKKNNESKTSEFVSEQVETTNLPVEDNDNTSEHTMNSMQDSDSAKNIICLTSSNKSVVSHKISENCSNNADYSNRTELPDNRSLTVSNQSCSNKPTRKMLKVIDISTDISTDDDNVEVEINVDMNKTNTNVGNKSFGKPQHESTPWTSSKNSKSNSYVQLNNTSNNISQITDFQNNVSIPEEVEKKIAYSPLPNLDVWSQMMYNFNESVEKEFFSADSNCKDVDISTVSKVLFNNKSTNACPTVQVKSPEEVLPSDDVNMEGIKSGTKRKNTVQCSLVSSCLLNNVTETPCVHETLQSTSNSGNLLKRTIVRKGSLRRKSVLAESSIVKAQIPQSTSSIENVPNPMLTELILPTINKNNETLSSIKTKSNKIDKPKKKMKSTKSNKRTQSKRVLLSNPIKPNTDTSEYESNDNTSEPLSSDSPSETSRKKTKIHVKENPLPVKKIEELTLKVTSSLRTKSRKHPVNTPVSQPNSKGPKCDSSTKSAITEISPATNLSQSQTLSSKRCTRNKPKLTASQISDNSLPETAVNKNDKRVTRAKKQGLSPEDSCDSVPSARKITRQQANIKETEVKKSATTKTKDKVLDVPSNMPVLQPNFVGPKCDSSTKSVITEISPVTNLSQSQTSSKRCTRNKPRLTASQISDNSLLETAVNKNDNRVTRAKKRGLSSEDSCDSVPSARKITRQRANIKETEVKKSATTKTKDKVLDVPGNTSVSQPNSKGPKCDSSTKSALTEITSVTNLSQSPALSSKRCTRKKSKLTASQISDNSLPETAVNKNEKRITRAKKRGLSSEDSCDSVPSARKITRQQANIKETELIKSATSGTKDKILDVPSTGTRVRFEKNVEGMTISAKKTRSTTQTTIPKATIVQTSPRVLRTREKKK